MRFNGARSVSPTAVTFKPILTKKDAFRYFFVFDAIFAELFSRFNVHSFRAFEKIVAKRAV